MLDIGFSELILIGVVALVVTGPERLPRVARTTGHLLGRFQRYVAEVKSDISREMELADLKKIRAEVEEAARSVEQTVKSQMQEAEDEFRSAEQELNKAGEGLKQMHAEVNQGLAALSMPHMGMGPAQGDATPGALPVADPATAGEERQTSGVEPSPQLELGLPSGGTPPAEPAPAQPAPTRQG
jgi:sec-independent protein translocase protein TatB